MFNPNFQKGPYGNMGGAFGYPNGMNGYNPYLGMGGGVYMPGMFPNGSMAGPWGLNGQGMMGLGMDPYSGMMGVGLGGGLNFGLGANPYGGMGGLNGYGGLGGGMMNPYGGLGGMGGLNGYGGLGGMGANNPLTTQYQQQMMQQQAQQYQTYLEFSRRYQENQIAKMRVYQSLSQELQSIQYRMQQLMMGGSLSGSLSLGGGFTSGSGTGSAPFSRSGTSNRR
jgi:hypothetical protein